MTLKVEGIDETEYDPESLERFAKGKIRRGWRDLESSFQAYERHEKGSKLVVEEKLREIINTLYILPTYGVSFKSIYQERIKVSDNFGKNGLDLFYLPEERNFVWGKVTSGDLKRERVASGDEIVRHAPEIAESFISTAIN